MRCYAYVGYVILIAMCTFETSVTHVYQVTFVTCTLYGVSWEQHNCLHAHIIPGRCVVCIQFYPAGGIVHLDTNTQQRIVTAHTVPQHLCCDDPYWLYHIYQVRQNNYIADIAEPQNWYARVTDVSRPATQILTY